MSDFQMYLTDTGFRLIDNPILIRLADALETSEMTFTELVEATGIPKSTASTYIRKLEHLGIVGCDEPDDENGRKVYRRKGMLFMRSGVRDTDAVPYADMDFSDIRSEDLFDKYFYWFLHASAEHNGFNLLPRDMKSFKRIGSYGCTHSDPPVGNFDEGLTRLKEYLEKTNAGRITFICRLPIEFEVGLTFDTASDKMHRDMLYSLGNLIAGYLESIKGFGSVLEVDTISGNRVRLASRPASSGDNTVRRPAVNGNCGFSIYWSSGRYVAVSKKIDNEIMDLVTRGSSNLKSISKELGKPLSTVSDSIDRLVSDNLLRHLKIHGHDTLVVNAPLVFGDSTLSRDGEDLSEDYLRRMWSEPTHFMTHLRHYEFYNYRALGFNLTNLLRVATLSFADNLCRFNTGKNAEEIFDILNRNSKTWFLAEMSVTSLHPFEVTFVKQIEQTPAEAELQLVLLSTFITRVLKNALGTTYRIADSRTYRDNTALSMSFLIDDSPGGGTI